MTVAGRSDDERGTTDGGRTKAHGDDSGVIDLARLVREMDAPSAPREVATEALCDEDDVEEVDDEVDEPAAPATPPAAAPRDERSVPGVELGVLAGVNAREPPLRTRPRRRAMAALASVVALALLGGAAYRAGAGRAGPPAPAAAALVTASPAKAPSVAPTAPEATAASASPGLTALPSEALPSAAIAKAPVNPDRSPRGARGAPGPESTPAALSLRDLPANAGATGDLGDAMRRATDAHGPVPIDVAAPQGAAATSLRPAAGALNAAIITASRNARACLAADDPIVHATLTFGADGHASVRVGKVVSSLAGAQSCVTAALGAAQVSPFVEAPIAVPVTVRP